MSRFALAEIPLVALFAGSCRNPPKLNVSGFWVPAMAIVADQDPDEDGRDIRFDADVETGGGWAARVGLQVGDDKEKDVELGILYMTTRHAESSADTHVTAHFAYFELFFPMEPEGDPPFLFAGIGVGIGGAVLDFDSDFPTGGGASALLRAEAGVCPVKDFSIKASVGGLVWGYPGEATGYGAFIMLGATLDF